MLYQFLQYLQTTFFCLFVFFIKSSLGEIYHHFFFSFSSFFISQLYFFRKRTLLFFFVFSETKAGLFYWTFVAIIPLLRFYFSHIRFFWKKNISDAINHQVNCEEHKNKLLVLSVCCFLKIKNQSLQLTRIWFNH